MKKVFGWFDELEYDTTTKKITIRFHDVQSLPDGDNTVRGWKEFSSPEEYISDPNRKSDDSYNDFIAFINATNDATRIYNATPHKIIIIENGEFNTTIRKWVCDSPKISAEIEPTGMLSAKIETCDADPINGIPVYGKRVIGCDPLPEEMGDNDIIVVSALYATAYRKMYGNDSRLYTIADPVYTPDGKTILGSRGICPAF